MKIILSILILFKSFSAIAQNHIIKVDLRNCKTDNTPTYGMLKLWKDGVLISDKVKCDYDNFEVKNLPAGVYVFEFKNIFDQTVKKNIQVKNRITETTLCNDEFVDTGITTLFAELKQNDTLTLEFSSVGCFHNFQQKSIFYKKRKKVFGELYVGNGTIIKKRLNTNERLYLTIFEKKVRIINTVNGYCTTGDLYKFSLNQQTSLSFRDSTCNWNGYSQMIKEIFGQ